MLSPLWIWNGVGQPWARVKQICGCLPSSLLSVFRISLLFRRRTSFWITMAEGVRTGNSAQGYMTHTVSSSDETGFLGPRSLFSCGMFFSGISWHYHFWRSMYNLFLNLSILPWGSALTLSTMSLPPLPTPQAATSCPSTFCADFSPTAHVPCCCDILGRDPSSIELRFCFFVISLRRKLKVYGWPEGCRV